MDAVAIRQLWPAVLDAVKRGKQRTRALLHDAQVASVDGDLITLTAPSPTLARMISEDSNVEVVRAALRDEVGGDWRITVQVLDTLPGRVAPADRGHCPRRSPNVTRATTPIFAAPPPTPADPEADALGLLQARLGARPIDS